MGGHLQSAQNLLSVQVEVQRSLNCALRVRVWLLIRDPSQGTSGELNDLGGLASNLSHLGPVKGTALQEESLNLDGTVDIDATLLERRDQLELVDGDVVHAGRLLTEGVEEGLWVEQVRDAHGLVQQLLLLDALHPLHELRALFAEDADPRLWVLWAFPHLLPRGWHRVLQKRSGLSLDLRSEHLSALQDLDDARDTLIDECEYLLDRDHLHVDELVNWIRCSELLATDTDGLKELHSEDILPQLKEWGQLLSPLLLVEAEFFCANCLQ